MCAFVVEGTCTGVRLVAPAIEKTHPNFAGEYAKPPDQVLECIGEADVSLEHEIVADKLGPR